MLKSIVNLGTVLNKDEQHLINGGRLQAIQQSCEEFCCDGDPSGGENYEACMANCDD